MHCSTGPKSLWRNNIKSSRWFLQRYFPLYQENMTKRSMADSEKACAYKTIRNNEFGSTKSKSNCDLRGNKDRHHCQTESLSSLGQTFCDTLPNIPELQLLLKNLNENLTQECCKTTCGE